MKTIHEKLAEEDYKEETNSIVPLLSKEHKCMLFRDECDKDGFLILKYGEIYRFGKDEVKILFTGIAMPSRMKKEGLIYDIFKISDGITEATAKVVNLYYLIDQGRFKRRPDRKGRWLENMSDKLGHDIMPFTPNVLRDENDYEDEIVDEQDIAINY